MRQRLASSAAVLALACLVLTPIAMAAGRSEVTLVNKSDWDIHHFFLSSTSEDEWGPDQLGDVVLESGARFELRAIPCDEYDVQLVDEDGDECVIEAVDLCASEEAWIITNDDLLDCQWGE